MGIFTSFKLASLNGKMIKEYKNSGFYNDNSEKANNEINWEDWGSSELFKTHLAAFFNIVSKDKELNGIVSSGGLTIEDLSGIFYTMLHAVVPNPIFKSGPADITRTFAPTAMYQEPQKQLGVFIASIQECIGIEDAETKRNAIFEIAQGFVRALKAQHDEAHGEILIKDIP